MPDRESFRVVGEICQRIGVVTGGAGDDLKLAADEGVDTFITGEGPHWTYALAEEYGINVFYGGHYATETFGVKALAAHLSKKFKLPWTFLDHPTVRAVVKSAQFGDRRHAGPSLLQLRQHAFGDFPADGQGGRRRGRGGINDMQNAGRLLEMEILDQFAVGGHGLGADAGAAGFQILFADFRHQSLQRAAEFAPGERAEIS